MTEEDQKICQSCGRPFEKRKKWQDNWEAIKYCSKACQAARSPDRYKELIASLLQTRGPEKSICPSEILSGENKKDPKKMERVRSAARLMVHEGKVEITQKGKAVDPNSFKGPIRIRLKK